MFGNITDLEECAQKVKINAFSDRNLTLKKWFFFCFSGRTEK